MFLPAGPGTSLQRQSGACLPNVKQAVRDLSDNADDERGAQVRYEIDRRVKAGQQQRLAELAELAELANKGPQQRECTSFAQVSCRDVWTSGYAPGLGRSYECWNTLGRC